MRDGFKFNELHMSYKSLFQDVRNSVDYVHMDGDLKERTCQNLSKYLKKDERLPKVLYNLKKSGAKTFLLTNSDWHYSNKVMEYLLDFPDAPYAGKSTQTVLIDNMLSLQESHGNHILISLLSMHENQDFLEKALSYDKYYHTKSNIS